MASAALVQLIQNHSYSPWPPLAWISHLPLKPREKRKWLAWAGHQAEELLELDMEGRGLLHLSTPQWGSLDWWVGSDALFSDLVGPSHGGRSRG